MAARTTRWPSANSDRQRLARGPVELHLVAVYSDALSAAAGAAELPGRRLAGWLQRRPCGRRRRRRHRRRGRVADTSLRSAIRRRQADQPGSADRRPCRSNRGPARWRSPIRRASRPRSRRRRPGTYVFGVEATDGDRTTVDTLTLTVSQAGIAQHPSRTVDADVGVVPRAGDRHDGDRRSQAQRFAYTPTGANRRQRRRCTPARSSSPTTPRCAAPRSVPDSAPVANRRAQTTWSFRVSSSDVGVVARYDFDEGAGDKVLDRAGDLRTT